MAAIVGAAGLSPTLAAARAGKKILLANKETLVMAGAVFMDAVRASGAALLPIDSEHNAIFQSLARMIIPATLPPSGVSQDFVDRIRRAVPHYPLDRVASTSRRNRPARIPTGCMGTKISVDSATMMNKGLEVIEAHWLFGARPDQIEVVIHPQSVIHSLVQYVDGSVLAQMGNPDMRTPIAHALA